MKPTGTGTDLLTLHTTGIFLCQGIAVSDNSRPDTGNMLPTVTVRNGQGYFLPGYLRFAIPLPLPPHL
ncbi:hypothetical protein DXD68_19405 [Parabacteroides sp. TM07-1AC]|nr:hypothetical protein DXD68_19405 [Parabacteroides sp. TM07-1AC]